MGQHEAIKSRRARVAVHGGGLPKEEASSKFQTARSMRKGRGDSEEEDETERQTEDTGDLLRSDLWRRTGPSASLVQDGVAERSVSADSRQGK